MIDGISKFDVTYMKEVSPLLGNTFKDPVEEMTKKIIEAQAQIRSWQTIMNIMEFNEWQCPLTGDVHIVLKYGKIVGCNHIGSAAEIVEDKS